MRRAHFVVAIVSAVGALGICVGAQSPAAGTARAVAPIDLAGTWVSVVTEDWRFRMVTPPKGDFASVPLNGAARTIANAWDAAKDEREGNACKSYGAAGLMRVPGRLKISWLDDTTLKIEADAGTQTRVLHFTPSTGSGQAPSTGSGQAPSTSSGPAVAAEPSWQGYSQASWEIAGGGFGGGRGAPAPRFGSLKVVTTRMKEGYLRKNGVPYSENAIVTEYFDRHSETDRSEWFTVTTIVEDAKYLTQNFVTSTHFKREADASKWSPSPCKAQ